MKLEDHSYLLSYHNQLIPKKKKKYNLLTIKQT